MSKARHPLKLKRVYDEPASDDGDRVLVERLWPRGMTRERAGLRLWLKELAPSHELRKWYGHRPERWPEFRKRYEAELQGHAPELDQLVALNEGGPVTLVFAAKDEARNSAVVLRDYLERRSGDREGA